MEQLTSVLSPGHNRKPAAEAVEVWLFKYEFLLTKRSWWTIMKAPSLSLALLCGLPKCLSPSRSEGYPPYGFRSMGSAPAADSAPTFLDAPLSPLHTGPPPLHQPITRALQSLWGSASQSSGSVPSWQPQGKKPLALFFFPLCHCVHLFFVCFLVFTIDFNFLSVDPCYPPLFHITHPHTHSHCHNAFHNPLS